ncbi:MAG: hypothetical protein WA063_00055 [Minisyncoccia bacterium]
MKSKISIAKKENKRLIEVLENEISAFMLFVFHGRENYGSTGNIPFEFSDPDFGGINKKDFTITGHIHSFTPKKMKETLERSELKIETSIEKLLESVDALQKSGYIEEGHVFIAEKAKRYFITKKGYMLAEFLSYSLKYPGQNMEERSDRQF